MQPDIQELKNTLSLEYMCPNCYGEGMEIFHETKNFPIHTVLNMTTREKAVHYPCGDIVLGFCPSCGFISNVAFDASLLEYSPECEESQGFSPTFNEFARRSAQQLIEKYDLRHKTIIEIGCGKGDFLTLLCELGQNQGIGFDPAYVPGRDQHQQNYDIKFIQDFYSEKYACYHGDVVCCRMTLEHIYNTADFVNMVRRSIGNQTDTLVFFQVPDVTRILHDCAFEDIYYEHCSYFSPGSLGRLFRTCGFSILDLRTDYDEQYLILEARPAFKDVQPLPFPLEEDVKTVENSIRDFQRAYRTTMEYWRRQMQHIKTQGKRAVVWGSGSKGVAFLTKLNISDEIEYVVDINPYRQGTYMAGTGQRIVAPEFLQVHRPDVVIIMNPIYRREIQQELFQLGLTPEVLVPGKEL
ncbi:C-methyltransferase [Candidatus Vecturithrix granuli]|uniref:C-methyltransferase n=1 Tax=Vecturithrix granuli TaxID=1499967 RepID=A0A081C2M1_VECG1|nr:C-methyltransferase [Candidatus Vecturithrix granuli]